jgi:hypothetical protein
MENETADAIRSGDVAGLNLFLSQNPATVSARIDGQRTLLSTSRRTGPIIFQTSGRQSWRWPSAERVWRRRFTGPIPRLRFIARRVRTRY